MKRRNGLVSRKADIITYNVTGLFIGKGEVTEQREYIGKTGLAELERRERQRIRKLGGLFVDLAILNRATAVFVMPEADFYNNAKLLNFVDKEENNE